MTDIGKTESFDNKAVNRVIAMKTGIDGASELQSNTATAKPGATPYCYRCVSNTRASHSCFFKD